MRNTTIHVRTGFLNFLTEIFHLTDSEVKEYHHWSPHESDNDEM